MNPGLDRADTCLDGKVTIVTGAARGIGRAIAERFAAAGAVVVCADRDRAALDQTVRQLSTTGAEVHAKTLDVADPEDIRAFWEDIERNFPALDVLVNNAGISPAPVRLHEISDADWTRCTEINLSGVFRCMQRALKLMMLRRSGSIVNIASVAGLRGFYPGFPVLGGAYGATKAAVVGLTRQAAVEYARDNIRVNAIAPGWIAGTRLGDARRSAASAAENERFTQTLLDRIPAGRFGAVYDTAHLAVFFASAASVYITGQVIAQDGGFTA